MTLAAGTRLGPYEIRASIGAGGMGEVYKARDTRLDRTVAIKILPETLAADPQFRERFDREARTISKLDHPHICTLYDVGEQDGSSFLVMQYLEGETLEARLKKGALPLAQALQVAAQIADALATAHKAGIVHRDLKPGNIMLTKSGARLLDFGLAKTGASVLSGTNLSILPTTPPITQPGSILGTFQYMAPEQLEGQEADARTDIFAFGAVVYEMVTGKKAFEGKSQAGLISVIMSGEPKPLLTQDPMVPPALDHVVKGCLAKDPDRRWQVAQDLLLQLRWIAEEGAQPGIRLPPTGQWRQREKITQILVAITSLLVVGVAALLFVSLRRPRTASEIRFLITAPNLADNSNNALAVSPDGRSIAFVAATPAKTFGLFVRQMGSTAPQLLAGTEGAANPFWSPDSRFIAFSANETLRKIDVSGGPPQTLCEWSGRNRAGAWNPEGTIVIASNNILYRVSAEGGRPTPLTALNVSRHETFLTSPDFLPDGRRFLYTAWSPEESNRAVYVGSLDSKDSTRLFAASSKALYADPGYLLYHREGVLLAQPFDAKKLEVTGEPVRIADQLAYTSTGAHAAFSVSQNGVLTYRDDSTSLQQFVWVDRTGKTLNSAGEPGRYGGFDLGPDGRQIAVARDDPSAPGNRDIWLLDPDRGGATRLTTDPAGEDFPVWSPDAHQIAFSSNRQGAYRIFWKQASGLGDETLLSESRRIDVVTDWSKDGRYIAYTSLLSSSDLYVLPQFGDRQPVAIVQSRFNKRQARFSFDSRWLAYASDESGQWQIDVISFPAADQKRQVSTSGGVQPRWKRDGTELYYLAPDGDLMAVTMKIGPTVEPGMPRALFDTKLVSVTGNVRDNYAVTPDGDRFLIKRPVAALKTDPITVVLNWQLALGARERR